MSRKSGLGKFVLGAGIGAAIALLFAPKKGSDLRRDIKKKFDAFMADVENLTIADIKEEFTNKVDELKKGIEELDKETVVKSAKKKGEELKEKSVQLVNLAREKGTPVLEGIAEDLREKTVYVAKEVVEKLEK